MKVDIKLSDREGKKMMAIFYDGDKRIKTTHFGQKGASDFTIHKDDDRKKLYLDRHRKNESWNDHMSAGSLSRYILWNKTSINGSIQDYKKKFNLN